MDKCVDNVDCNLPVTIKKCKPINLDRYIFLHYNMEKGGEVLKMNYNLGEIEEAVLGKLFFYESIDSTNKSALNEVDAPDKSVFLSEIQLAGRGRLGRNWSSNSDGIYMTILLKPNFDITNFSVITLVCGLAVANAIDDAKIKWPNDIILSGKKVCGILTESKITNQPSFAVGIGINVNNEKFSDDLKDKATSLYLEFGEKQDKTAIVVAVLREFWKLYEVFLKNGFSAIKAEYIKKSATIGKEVVIIKGDEKLFAKAVGITDKGELIVEKDGEQVILNAGEVSVRGLLGYN